MPFADDETDDLDDADFPEEDSDEEDDTIPCPYCRKAVYEEAERCPHCERYISREDAPIGPVPWWMVVGVILCTLVLLAWIFGG
jgi:hypothetical protein